MKNHMTNVINQRFKRTAKRLLKAWICITVIMISIQEIKGAYLIMFFLALLSYLEDKNPVYLGLSDKTIKESRIIKFGFPLVIILGLPILLGSIYLE